MKKIIGLIGFPLDHSWSPSYFQKQFQQHGFENFSYRLFPLESLDHFLPLLKATPDLCGFNVTIPYKEAILSYLTHLDPITEEIGAVNTVLIQGSGEEKILLGYNTDAEGFMRSADFSGYENALILGTGGAARAVAYALVKLGINYTLVSRAKASANAVTYCDLNDTIMDRCTLIINTTPVGMYPNTESSPPLPYDLISSRHFLYDLVYNPAETLFMKQGRKQGAVVQSGLKMLHYQAELAFNLFVRA